MALIIISVVDIRYLAEALDVASDLERRYLPTNGNVRFNITLLQAATLVVREYSVVVKMPSILMAVPILFVYLARAWWKTGSTDECRLEGRGRGDCICIIILSTGISFS